jgi:hypothetical protein
VSPLCAQKLARLQTIVAERGAWREQLAQIKRLHSWLLEVEHLLDRSLGTEGEVVSNLTVGNRLDSWRERMSTQLTDGSLSELERSCLTEFLQVLSNLRPYLVQCYDRQDFPRTNDLVAYCTPCARLTCCLRDVNILLRSMFVRWREQGNPTTIGQMHGNAASSPPIPNGLWGHSIGLRGFTGG